MALFTDGTISTLEELRGYESGLYDVASIEGIDLSQKLVLAHQELGVELTARFFWEQPSNWGAWSPSPLWHIFRAWLTYRTRTALNDRYLANGGIQRMANWASGTCSRPGSG
jgi:hypothetical protein